MNAFAYLLPGEFYSCARQRPKVLVVNQDPNFLEQLRGLLRAIPLDIETASDAREGFYKLQEQGFDLALIEEQMAGMSGTELVELIHPLQPSLSILLTNDSIRQAPPYEFIQRILSILNLRTAA